MTKTQSQLLESIRQSIIGESEVISTAFGDKPLVYADYTASGRSLAMIEDFIRDKVLPFYANTHTETSHTGAQTTALREEARAQIANALNANKEYAVIFCGSGATSAIDKLITILNLRLPYELDQEFGFLGQIPAQQRPVIFIGPYEHHSNELPWRESIAEVISIPLTDDGLLNHDYLEAQLQLFADRPLKIGSFSAASNVTGIKTRVNEVASLLHKYGALSFWDYAAAAPYLGIDMQGEAERSADKSDADFSKDAVFLSPHKFVGGPGTPGILVVKRSLLNNAVPAVSGGGTVSYVTPADHQYINDVEHREEGGTPAIVESIRAGLVFKLQQSVGTDLIEQLEKELVKVALKRWQAHPDINILGNTETPRLSIISFQILHHERELHYNFVVALLNDLFGIQARGGCSCAGPYGHSLLAMDMTTSKAIENQLSQGQMILRPGWVRVNFNYFIDPETFDYIASAIELIADFGWRLLPLYKFDSNKGVWHYRGKHHKASVSLNDLDFINPQASPVSPKQPRKSFSILLQEARELLCKDYDTSLSYPLEMSHEANNLRSFVLPHEIADLLSRH